MKLHFQILCVIICLLTFLTNTYSQKIHEGVPTAVQRKGSIITERELNQGEANIWYLLHCGFAVKTHTKLLIFDYIPVYSEEKSIPVNLSLEKGFINPEEIKSLDVYVFVSHEHGDHFNNVIFDWERKIKSITYFFGWQAGESKKDNYIYMIGPRAEKKINGMEVFTINSFHARVPEVAFLIKVDGLVVYFSGDYRGDYKNDNEFLKSKVNRVDIAFMNIDHYGDDLKPNEADFIEKLMPRIVFPMHYGNDEDVLKRNADKVKKAGYRTKLICVEKRGDQFFFDNLKDLKEKNHET